MSQVTKIDVTLPEHEYSKADDFQRLRGGADPHSAGACGKRSRYPSGARAASWLALGPLLDGSG